MIAPMSPRAVLRALEWLLLLCLCATASASPRSADLAQAPAGVSVPRSQSALLWSRAGSVTPQARALVALLQSAADYGLNPQNYEAPELSAEVAALPAHEAAPADCRRLDLALTEAALTLVRHLHFGRVDPRAAGFDMPPRRESFDATAIVEQLATAADPAAVLATVEPAYLHYRLLRQALARYRVLAAAPAPPALPSLPRRSVKPGEHYAGAPALRERLAALGDLPPGQAARPDELLDDDLAAALRHFQYLHGLAQDGALGASTLNALRVPLTQRVRQIELTLERWRWVPPLRPPTLIVNIPQFRLFLIRTPVDDEAEMLRMNVIVGRQYPQLHTPVFTADMTSVLFRPYWDVPPSIVRHELLADLSKDPHYLEGHDMELVSNGAGESGVALAATPENLEALAAGRLRLRQRPGADNALGLVKFDLPNSYDVYLHSTPAQRLFDEPRRAFSHGCIRVGDPVALATEVLRGTAGEWTPERIRAAMNGDRTLRVWLARPVQVLILYGTAVATEDGAVHFFDDIYGQDRRLEILLGLRPVTDRS